MSPFTAAITLLGVTRTSLSSIVHHQQTASALHRRNDTVHVPRPDGAQADEIDRDPVGAQQLFRLGGDRHGGRPGDDGRGITGALASAWPWPR